MKSRTRFIQSVISTAKREEVELPWTRGKRRKAFIAKRTGPEKPLQRTA